MRGLSEPGPVARVKYQKSYILLNKIRKSLKNINGNYKTGEIIKVRDNSFSFMTVDKKKIEVLKWKSEKKIKLKIGDLLG